MSPEREEIINKDGRAFIDVTGCHSSMTHIEKISFYVQAYNNSIEKLPGKKLLSDLKIHFIVKPVKMLCIVARLLKQQFYIFRSLQNCLTKNCHPR